MSSNIHAIDNGKFCFSHCGDDQMSKFFAMLYAIDSGTYKRFDDFHAFSTGN